MKKECKKGLFKTVTIAVLLMAVIYFFVGLVFFLLYDATESKFNDHHI